MSGEPIKPHTEIPTLAEEARAEPGVDLAARLAADKHLNAVGRVAAHWAVFEAVIDSSAIRLAPVEPKIGVCFTAQIAGHGRKLDAYISLARLKGAPSRLISELCEFAKDANGVSEQRNRAVHDPWFFDDAASPQRLEATARKKLRLEFIPVATSEVIALADLIAGLTSRFEAMDAQMPSPDTGPSGSRA